VSQPVLSPTSTPSPPSPLIAPTPQPQASRSTPTAPTTSSPTEGRGCGWGRRWSTWWSSPTPTPTRPRRAPSTAAATATSASASRAWSRWCGRWRARGWRSQGRRRGGRQCSSGTPMRTWSRLWRGSTRGGEGAAAVEVVCWMLSAASSVVVVVAWLLSRDRLLCCWFCYTVGIIQLPLVTVRCFSRPVVNASRLCCARNAVPVPPTNCCLATRITRPMAPRTAGNGSIMCMFMSSEAIRRIRALATLCHRGAEVWPTVLVTRSLTFALAAHHNSSIT